MEAQLWIDHAAAIEREGGSARGHAKEHGISISAVYDWQRKSRAAPGEHGTVHPGAKFMALRIAAISGMTTSSYQK